MSFVYLIIVFLVLRFLFNNSTKLYFFGKVFVTLASIGIMLTVAWFLLTVFSMI